MFRAPTPIGCWSRPARPESRLMAGRWPVGGVLFGFLLVCLLVTGCSKPEPEDLSPRLIKTSFDELPGWRDDDPAPALRAFLRSCDKLAAAPAERDLGLAGSVGDWQAVCLHAREAKDARTFFETRMVPWRVRFGDEQKGLFTGYYEPLLYGSRELDARFDVPLRARPTDLVSVDLGAFDPEWKGRRLAGRVQDGVLRPYADRAAIDAGAIDDHSDTVLWVDDRIAKFFLQIQGSGQVRLVDGSVVRVGYAAQNGRPYRAIGRDLIEMGALTREEVSLQSIRRWLEDNPDRADALMHKNASYVFFRELDDLADASGPLGAQNVPLEPGRSLAVDRKFWAMGMPVWLDTTAPFPDGERPLRRLLVAQDTGGAIRGPIRGDVFWGAGDLAEHVAGHMKSRGRMVVLLPKVDEPAS